MLFDKAMLLDKTYLRYLSKTVRSISYSQIHFNHENNVFIAGKMNKEHLTYVVIR